MDPREVQKKTADDVHRESDVLEPRSQNGKDMMTHSNIGWDGTAAIDQAMWNDAAAETIRNSGPGKAPPRHNDQGVTEMWRRAVK